MSASKAKGTAWESAIAAYLQGAGWVHAERRTLSGANDRGDVAGLPGVVIEAKNAPKLSWLAGWTRLSARLPTHTRPSESSGSSAADAPRPAKGSC